MCFNSTQMASQSRVHEICRCPCRSLYSLSRRVQQLISPRAAVVLVVCAPTLHHRAYGFVDAVLVLLTHLASPPPCWSRCGQSFHSTTCLPTRVACLSFVSRSCHYAPRAACSPACCHSTCRVSRLEAANLWACSPCVSF